MPSCRNRALTQVSRRPAVVLDGEDRMAVDTGLMRFDVRHRGAR